MFQRFLSDKPSRLFLFLTAFFVANALIAECIGNKLFSLEALLGLPVRPFTLLGQEGLTYTLTCGVLLWPLEFVLTDIINEYYGPRAVRRISYIAVALIGYAFLAFYLAIHMPADDGFWRGSQRANGIPDMQVAFEGIFGQSMRIIAGSLVAFLVSQVLDVWIFHRIKRKTGERKVWLRATGSTAVSQLVDSFIVLAIAFGPLWGWQRVLAVGLVNYSYKLVVAILLTPVIYAAERRIETSFGKDLTAQLKAEAMGKN
ncbi:MAG: VUT family protein [Sphingobacteriales bacterium]|nr:MAG: VUT family protein [Sphingobacteriales bacterium]